MICLPEMFATSFSMNASAVREPAEGPTWQYLAKQAADRSVFLLGAFVEEGTNVPVADVAGWDLFLHARALENLAYVVGINRIGHGDDLAFDGRSHIVSPLATSSRTVPTNPA